MGRTGWVLTLIALGSLAGLDSSFTGEKIGSRLAAVLQGADLNDQIIAWVYFVDKGSPEMSAGTDPTTAVSERSIQRRLKVLPEQSVVDYSDLPVAQHYLANLAPHIRLIRQQSKWFNAVSVVATKAQIAEIQELPFVKGVELVARFRKPPTNDTPQIIPDPAERPPALPFAKSNGLDYGKSLGQLAQINVPAVHSTGNYGQGVIVGVFDNGFRLLTHEAFGGLNILATRDFVDHKTSVVPDNLSSVFGGHGVETLSTIAGYKPGQLIGPAFGATYVLARTENDSSETPMEEDNWVAGIEWADSIGVQVTSTSVVYLSYDTLYPSWSWQDMNGRTTVISKAAAMAVRKGIVVVNCAGNDGLNGQHNTLNAPADADSVISVGAVDVTGTRASFSSIGPTTSIPPRVKPDVMARGTSVYVASTTNPTGYIYDQGTSFSCPLAAGVAALILHADSQATPFDVANAMRSTASRANAPDNLYGWGIIDALAAINFLSAPDTGDNRKPNAYILEQNYPNPFNPYTIIRFFVPQEGFVSLEVFNILGEEIQVLVSGVKIAGIHEVRFDGSELPSGVYYYKISAGSFLETKKMVLVK